MAKRLLVIGLDGTPPELLFDRRKELPNIGKLMSKSMWAPMLTCIPPITNPAWQCMFSSRDPGEIGVYGFRNREGNSYNKFTIANSHSVKVKRVWDILTEHGKKSGVLSVPLSYPPQEINGFLITSFLSIPGRPYTYPLEFQKEIEELVNGEYLLDVYDFDDKKKALEKIYKMTEQNFIVLNNCIKNKEWDFLTMVFMGPDRLHHGYWGDNDPKSIKYQAGNEFKNSIHDYYQYLDKKIGETLELLDDETAVMIVSDHGAQRVDGCIVINEWLQKKGYQKLKTSPNGIVDITRADVDWENTKAWGWGGYYSAIFLNVKNREENGAILPEEYDKVRNQLAEQLSKMNDANGKSLKNTIIKPNELYKQVKPGAPDLVACFGDLHWEPISTIGHSKTHIIDPALTDEANHSWHGVFMLYDPTNPVETKHDEISIYDIAPTALAVMNVPIPREMKGKSLITSN